MARDRIVQANPEDLSLVLNASISPSISGATSTSLTTTHPVPFRFPSLQLWSLRLSSLARLRLFNQVSAEATNLYGAFGTIDPPSTRAHVLEHVLPFELDVIHARVRYWAGDAHGYADALGALLRRCRRRARGARIDSDRQMWIERGARVGLITASHFIEIKVCSPPLPSPPPILFPN
jgi:trafficking protein particle complex subunit 12